MYTHRACHGSGWRSSSWQVRNFSYKTPNQSQPNSSLGCSKLKRCHVNRVRVEIILSSDCLVVAVSRWRLAVADPKAPFVWKGANYLTRAPRLPTNILWTATGWCSYRMYHRTGGACPTKTSTARILTSTFIFFPPVFFKNK